MERATRFQRAFTLIEISIVLVILGLLAGGVLVGRDLIAAATIRAQISQIQKYQTAINTFQIKYNALPGDMDATTAAVFGFTPRSTYSGGGDSNGLLEGGGGPAGMKGILQGVGETGVFWVDLTSANGLKVNLIEGNFSTADNSGNLGTANPSLLMPTANIGGGNYVYVYTPGSCCGWVNQGGNRFGLSKVTLISGGGDTTSVPGMSVMQAYSIDNKIDDGKPQTGQIITQYASINGCPWSTNAATPSLTTCYDTTSGQYSITQNNGMGLNCALSFLLK